MPRLTVDFEAFCDSCGRGMCSNVFVRSNEIDIDIEPCAFCMQEAIEEAVNNALEKERANK